MNTKNKNLGRLAALLMASSAIGGAAFAEPALSGPPPVRNFVDPNGVDLATGIFRLSTVDVAVGPSGGGGLSFVHSYMGTGWRDSLIGTITHFGNTYTVSLGASSETFTLSGGVYTADQGTGSSLTFNSTTNLYTYTLANSVVAVFDKGLGDTQSVFSSTDGRVSTITSPTGEKMTYEYFTAQYCSDTVVGACGDDTTPIHRVSSVSNNHGFVLNIRYENPSFNVNPSNINQWRHRIRVTSGNDAGGAGSFPTADYATTTMAGGASSDTITDALSNVTTYTYSGALLTGIKRPGAASNDVTIAYDGSNRVHTVQTVAGTWTYAYSDAGNVRTTTVTFTNTDPTPITRTIRTVTSKIAEQEVTGDKDALNHSTTYAYDTYGRLTTVTNPEGDHVTYNYDERGNVTSTVRTPKAGASGTITTSADYPDTCSDTGVTPQTCNSPISTTDERGFQTDYTYNTTTGQVLTVKRPAPDATSVRPKTTFTYTPLSARYSIGGTVTNGPAISVLTGVSRCITKSGETGDTCTGTADESKTTIGYVPAGSPTPAHNLLPLTVTRSSGNSSGTGAVSVTTTLAYDGVGNLTSGYGPGGSAETAYMVYDADRRRTGAISADPDGAGTLLRRAQKVTYNADGTVYTSAQGTTTGTTLATFSPLITRTLTYDTAGRLTQSTGDGKTMQYSYDTSGRPLCAALRLGTLTGAACTMFTDATLGEDRIVQYGYDELDRVNAVTSGLGSAAARTEHTTFTDNGLVSTLSDGRSRLTTYDYDGYDRLKHKYYPNSNDTVPGSNANDYDLYDYDAASSVTSLERHKGQYIFYEYDNLNRLKTLNLGFNDTEDTRYSYDNLDRVISASKYLRTPPMQTSYAYNAIGWMMSETGPLGMVSYAYDTAGRRSRLTWPGGNFYVTYAYDNTGAMTGIYENGNTSTGQLAGFGYTNLGERGSLTQGDGASVAYGYDTLGRLHTQALDLPSSGKDVTFTLNWNAAGQMTDRTAGNAAYGYSAYANQNVSYDPNGLNRYDSVGGTNYAYNLQGDVKDDGPNTYTYNVLGQFKTFNTTALTLDYDPEGRLYETDGANDSRLLYDGDDVIAEYSTSGTLLRRYVHGPGADEPLVWYEGATTTNKRWLSADERGSIVAVTSGSAGSWTTSVNNYDNYGIPAAGNTGRFQYTGQQWLPEAGFYHYKNRVYSPKLGRFMQEDPIGNGDGLNEYAYVHDDPMNGRDPWGLADEDDLVAVWKYKPQNPFPAFNGMDVPGVGTVFPDGTIGFDRDHGASVVVHAPKSPKGFNPMGFGNTATSMSCVAPSADSSLGDALDRLTGAVDQSALQASMAHRFARAPTEGLAKNLSNGSWGLTGLHEAAIFVNNLGSGVDVRVAASYTVGRISGEAAWYGGGKLAGFLVGTAVGGPADVAFDAPGIIGAEVGGSIALGVGQAYQGPGSVNDFGNLAANFALTRIGGC